jgi:superfamily I DNA and/or RNA helicase
MSNVYISNLMQQQRFDAVIVEEASMAVLPTLFYCAALAAERVIIVGDPRQLPPIVQSTEPYVQRAMGRSIFEITVPEPHNSDLVVMLDTQYRMHPKIGDLVGDLFYQGRLHHSPITHQTAATTRSRPYANEPLVVVDTSGQTTCATPPGTYSRYNEKTAAACVALAAQAVADGIESVALITPYVEQSRRIRRLLLAARGLAEKVECRTVHRFQVDAAPLPPGTLLASTRPNSSAPNLINVSISRARAKLIILADVAYFKQYEPNGVISAMLRQASASGLLVSLGADDDTR